MIIVEHPYHNRADRIRHSSDSGVMILQEPTGVLYVEAVDVFPTAFSYRETDIPIETTETEEKNDE